ncbi:MAG: 6-aminohexanoate hydrolase, partial [Mesorhizobium sp.]|nr:6-aminohexanoate hydrolase [Mesorhizobium sp.]
MTGPTPFEKKFGFARKAVTLANWRTAPFSRWSFQNVGEIVPSAAIAPAGSTSQDIARDMAGLLSQS